MKRLSITLLALCLLLLAACQAQTAAPGSSVSSTPSTNPLPQVQIGSTTGRYPQGSENAYPSYGPTGESVPLMTENDVNQVVSLKQHGAVGNGTADDSAALENALAATKGKGFLQIEKGVYKITKNISVAADVVLVFASGAQLQIAEGVALTIKGFVQADVRQIFSGEGTVQGLIRNAGYPQWFGPVGTEDDSVAFQSALDTLQEVKVPYGISYKVNNLKIYHPVSIYGEGAAQVNLTMRDSGKRLFDIRSSNVCIKGFKIEGNESEISTIIYFNTAEGDLQNITIASIWARKTGYFLRDAETGGQHTVCNADLLDLRVDLANKIGYHLTDFRTGIRLNCVQRQNLGAQFDVEEPGMLFCNIEDMYMADIDITGGTGQDCYGNALMFKNCKNVTLDRAMMEAVNGYNLYMEGCSGFSFNQWVGGEYNDVSLRMVNCENIEFNLMLLIGNNYAGSTFPKDRYSPDAIYATDCHNVTFNGLDVQRFFGNGVVLENCSYFTINSLTSWANCGTVFEERGTSNHNTIVGLNAGDCEGKTLILLGKDSKVVGAALNDGTFEAEIKGPCER